MPTTDIAANDAPVARDQRAELYRLVPTLLEEHDRAVLVLAEIGAGYVAVPPHLAERVVDVGIREQLLIGAAAGLALTGLRPLVHGFPPFLVERPFEQLKADLDHQGVGAVLVSAGGSYGWPEGGQTHHGHRDVPLLDTLSGWTVHAPGHPAEVAPLLRRALAADGRVYVRLDPGSNGSPSDVSSDRVAVVRRGLRGTVVAVGPLLDRVLAAVADLDVTVLHAITPRPFDGATLLATLDEPAVVVVEPWQRGASAHLVADALRDVPHRLLSMGVDRVEHRRYGTVAHHDRLHGLDVDGLRRSIRAFLLV